MKPEIHPKYVLSTVTCACGNSFTTRSTKPVIRLDICAMCHPFFTGKQKLLDTAGRVEKFQKRFATTEGKMVARKPKAAKTSKTTTPKAKARSTAAVVVDPKAAKAAKLAKKAEKKTAPAKTEPAAKKS